MKLSNIMNNSISEIEPEGISTFSKQISNIPNLIRLTVGEPDLDTPSHVKNAGIKAIQNNNTHYTEPSGIKEVLKAAANFVKQKYDIHYNYEKEVVTTIGVSEAILDTYLAILNDGDEVLIPSPAFPVYAGAARVAGGKASFIDVSDDNFKLTPEKLSDVLNNHPKAKILILTCPNNPTGIVYDKNELESLANVVKKHNIMVISDEIYSEINYNDKHYSFAQFLRNQTIVFNGLSKSHAMTGWRFGVVFAPEEIMQQISKTHLFNTYNVSAIVQAAAIESFSKGIDDPINMKNIYQSRRDLVTRGLKAAHIDFVNPEGAFYIFAKIPNHYSGNSLDFCLELANKFHIGVVPGSAFGPGGEGYFRISYAASSEILKEAMKRIQEFSKSITS